MTTATATGVRPSLPRITDRDVCLRCVAQQCTLVCPTRCYSPRDDRRVDLDLDPCVACRACVEICFEFLNIEWRPSPPAPEG